MQMEIDDAIDYRDLFSDARDFINRFVDCDANILNTCVPFIAYTYLTSECNYCPRLYISSATKQCGKSVLIKVLKDLVHKGEYCIDPSPAVLYTLIELEHPTLLIDEIDRLYERKDTSAITAILNSGFERGAKVPRVGFDKDGNRTIERYDVFGPVIIAGIDKGYLPDTLDDRLIEIRLQKNTGPEKPEYDPVLMAAETAELRTRFEKFAEEIREDVRTAEPYIPPGIRDRYKNKWKTLFIMADGMDDCNCVTNVTTANSVGLCGYKTRQAALNFLQDQQEKEAEQTDYSVLVIHHIDEIFDLTQKEELTISTILDQLHNMSEAPWSTFEYNKPLTALGLRKLLKRHKVKASKPVRFGNASADVAKGYSREHFEKVLRQYPRLRPDTPLEPVTAVTRLHMSNVAPHQII